MRSGSKFDFNHLFRYWKEFPRKLEVYQEHLRVMQELFSERPTAGGSKDVSLIITNILNILPIASKKYCYRFGIETVFH
jgi:Uma2 family endonuclease